MEWLLAGVLGLAGLGAISEIFSSSKVEVKDETSFYKAMEKLEKLHEEYSKKITKQFSVKKQEEEIISLAIKQEEVARTFKEKKEKTKNTEECLSKLQEEITTLNAQRQTLLVKEKEENAFRTNLIKYLGKVELKKYADDMAVFAKIEQGILMEKSKNDTECTERICHLQAELKSKKEIQKRITDEVQTIEKGNIQLKELLKQCKIIEKSLNQSVKEADEQAKVCDSFLQMEKSKKSQYFEVESKMHLFKEHKEVLIKWDAFKKQWQSTRLCAEICKENLKAQKESTEKLLETVRNIEKKIEADLTYGDDSKLHLLEKYIHQITQLIEEEQKRIKIRKEWLIKLDAFEKSLYEKKAFCDNKAAAEKELFEKRCKEFSSKIGQYLSYKEVQKLKMLYTQITNMCQKAYCDGLERNKVGPDGGISFEEWVKIQNDTFIKEGLWQYGKYFDEMFKYPLDLQQRTAVLADEDYMQVIAGAGSGKTTTIQAKVKYLVEKRQVPPEQILLLAFNHSAKDELMKRICEEMHIPVKAHTFHSFGLSVVKDTLGSRKIHEEGREGVIDTKMEELIRRRGKKDASFAKKLLDFAILYQVEPKSKYDFDKMDSYYKMLSSVGYSSLRSSLQKDDRLYEEAYVEYEDKKTLQGEQVRSYEELVIANYLFLNGISYEYEKIFPEEEWGESGNKAYTPDFYLPEYDLYWEHFGVNRQGRLPHLKEAEERAYIQSMNQKKKRFEELGRRLVESYSWHFTGGKIYEHLDAILEVFEIEKKPIDANKVLQILLERSQNRLFNQSTKLLGSYLSLYKSRLLKKKDMGMAKSMVKCGSDFERKRRDLFFSVFEEIFNEYEQKLKCEQKIDFNDMLSMAIEQINGNEYRSPFTYVIVDEYQDMSYSRQKLLEVIVSKNTDTKLFGVGDDWQSIYGFTGSDLDYFAHFDKYWPHSLQLKIEQTHRNSQELVNLAGDFVMKNPFQVKKDLRAKVTNEKPIMVMKYEENARDSRTLSAANYAVLEAIEWIKRKKGNIQDKEILLLGRNNATVEEVKKLTQSKHRYSTVHRSKGAEALAVVLVDVLDGMAGFPNQMTDDPILQSLLAEPENYAYAQERRLFYVALTRTKSYVVITTDEHKTSSFVNEILKESKYVDEKRIDMTGKEKSVKEAPVCRLCKGSMVLRQNSRDGSFFWGCSNYSRYFDGCSYTENITV